MSFSKIATSLIVGGTTLLGSVASSKVKEKFPAECPPIIKQIVEGKHVVVGPDGQLLSHVIGFHGAGKESFESTAVKKDENGQPLICRRDARSLFYGSRNEVIYYARASSGGEGMVGVVVAEKEPHPEKHLEPTPEVNGVSMPYAPPLTAEGQKECGVFVVHPFFVGPQHDPRTSAAFARAIHHLKTEGVQATLNKIIQ